MKVQLKRAYVPAGDEDGFRVLVDRLWPRGIKKENLAVDLWMKDLAPSTELRKFFSHDSSKWDIFRERYLEELASKETLLDELLGSQKDGTLTLVYGAKDEEHNQAVVLKELLTKRLSSR